MKRKKSTVLTMSGPRWDAVTVTLFSIFLFFAMNLWTEPAAVGFAFIALVLVIGRTPWRLARERFCVPVLGLLGFMLMNGLAAIYSPFGGSAVRDYRSILPAFALAALVLLRFERRHVRGLLWGVAAVCGVLSLLSTDMACEGALFEGFNNLMARFHAAGMYLDLENTVGRVNGVYNDANVTGSLFALGSLVALYLTQMGQKWWERLLACVLIGVNAVGLLLSVSRGAILCFGVSLLVWLIAAGTVHRIRLFLLMVVSAGACLAAFMPASAAVAPGAVLPNVLAVASGGVIFLLDRFLAEPLARKLAGHGKAVAAVMGSVVAAAGIFVIVALTLTEPYVLGENDFLYRSAVLAPGEYTLSVDWEGSEDQRVVVHSRSRTEALMNQDKYLYDGPLSSAVFTVPDDAERVFFQFWGSPGDIIRSATVSDGTELTTAYKLLPEAITYRMQAGFFQDYSYLVRVQYMKDAWKLFKQSPVIGHGLGSTDNLYPTVQPFPYTSRYAHNHILQVMSDMGLLGLLSLLTLLGGVLWLVVRAVWKDRDPLAAVLLACWVMMNTHSLMEINFSVQPFPCMALVLLLLPVVLYGRPLPGKVTQWGGVGVCLACWLYLGIFGGLLGLRQRVRQESDMLRATSISQLMEALDSYARRDVFDPDPYRLEYVNTALEDTEGLYSGRMLQYVERIRKSGNYPACAGLLYYYYLPAGDFKGLFECSLECLAQRMSYPTVWNEQMEFYRTEVLSAAGETHIEEFAEGMLAFQAYLEEVNGQETRIRKIVLTEENQSFLDTFISAQADGITGGALYRQLTAEPEA